MSIMSKLPAECLNEIFEYLEDDKFTLYSCLLVNRLWCGISVRMLWRNVRNYRTLIACLPKVSKDILYNNGIIVSPPTSKNPLFNYITFVKNISIYRIDNIIKIILHENQKSISIPHIKFIVAQEIFKSLMNQITSLKGLYFDSYKRLDIYNAIFISYPGAEICLKYLSKLNCHSSIYSEFFYQLSLICHNIQTLKIRFDNVISKGLMDLISVQQNLKYLGIILSYECENLLDIIPSLKNLPNTLIKLDFSGGNHIISLSFIAKLKNLQKLILSFDYNHSIEDFTKLQYVSFPQLQVLKFDYAYPRHELLIKFLEVNGKSLKEFYIGNNDNSLNLAIAKSCPNLRKLFTIFRKDELETFKMILNNCQYLESIEVWCGNDYLDERKLFDIIAKYSHKNFFELKLYYVIFTKSKLSKEELEDFFINWSNRTSRKPLSMIFFFHDSNSYNENNENMEIIEKYKSLGVIKKFRIIM
ncbi:hypothetical protein RclHR1_02290009 [Rhizophagus clarus]|uniref:F-box domain-containing protein n=1 Tax=Rhizophagus clarus TaxID=94130 RepID=A0A2Z6QUT4_9GLOM|nr:hypothetical protein RclHR1_02290009 [Rhizophagus clarus]